MKTKTLIFSLFVIILIINNKLISADNIYWYLGGTTSQGITYDIRILEDINEIITISDIERKIRIIDLSTNNLKSIISPAYDDNNIAYLSPDGKILIKSNSTRINIFNFKTGEFLYSLNQGWDWFYFSDNSKYLFTGYWNSNVQSIYTLQTGEYIAEYSFKEYPFHNISIDSNANILQVDSLGRLTKFNFITKQNKIDTIIYTERLSDNDSSTFYGSCILSRSENLLLTINSRAGKIKVYNINSNKVSGSIEYIPSWYHNIYFSDDEKKLILCMDDINFPSISIDFVTGDTIKKFNDINFCFSSGYTQYINGISYSGKFFQIDGFSNQIIDYYNLNTKEQHPIKGCAGEVLKISFSKDNKMLFTYEKKSGITSDRSEDITRVQAFDVSKKKRIWVSNELFKIEKWGAYLNYYPMALSSNNKYVAIASTDSSYTSFPVILIEAFTNPSYPYIPDILNFKGHVNPVTAIAISDDEKYLASGDTKGNIKIWDIEKHSLIKDILTNEEEIFSLRFINNDEIEFTCKDGNQNWNISTGKQINKFTNPMNLGLSKDYWNYYPNFPVVYSNDGNYCVYNNHNNGINIYNTQTNDTLGKLDSGEVLMCSFSDNNKYLATSHKNENYVSIWDFQNKTEVARYDYNPYMKVFHHLEQDSMWAPLEALSFSHDGKYIAGGNYDGSVVIWENTINGVNDKSVINKAGFEIYPNPASSSVKLKYESSGYSKLQISIFDLLGNEVFNASEDCNIGTNEKVIDCHSLATGYYIMRLKQGERVETKPFVKIKNY